MLTNETLGYNFKKNMFNLNVLLLAMQILDLHVFNELMHEYGSLKKHGICATKVKRNVFLPRAVLKKLCVYHKRKQVMILRTF